MRPIKVLDIAHYMMCPPKSGGVQRMLSPLSHMSESEIEFDFLFATYDPLAGCKCSMYIERIPVVGCAEFVVYEENKLFADLLPGRMPEDVWNTISRRLLDKAVEMVSTKEYDIVQIEHSFLSWLVPYIRAASPNVRIVLDAHNAEYRIIELWDKYDPSKAMHARAAALKEWEFRTWAWFDAIVTVSSYERDLVREVSGVDKVYEVPTGGGIDVIKYEPEPDVEKTYDILYIGTMDWYPNAQGLVWFMEQVLPIIQQKRPGTRFHIIGSGSPNQAMLAVANRIPGVEFLGFQADDVYFFHRARVFVVPLWIGGGARVKIPTAWAAGIPVVSTTFGAEGNGAQDSYNILLADTPEDFAEAVLKILASAELSGTLSKNALDQVRSRFTTEYCAKKLVEIYRDILS